MQIVRDLGGYTYGRSDLVRRAMSKKKMDVMEEERSNFVYGRTDDAGNVLIEGCIRRGVPEEAGHRIFDEMVKFAEYAFNKSHAAAYAMVAFQTAWLKCYYPREFMAALMTSMIGDSAQVAKYIRNCREMGIEVLPPDINTSRKKFSVRDGKITFGLLGIKNVGEGVVDEIIRVREDRGPFRDFFDFIGRVDIHKINKKAVESMIKAGVFDSLGAYRSQLMAVYEGQIEAAQNTARRNVEGQMSLFQDFSGGMEAVTGNRSLPATEEFPQGMLLSMEKEMLGLYVSGHPLDEYRQVLGRIVSMTTEDLIRSEETGEVYDGMKVVLAGLVTARKTLITKSSKRMGFVTLEDFSGSVECIIFPGLYEEAAPALEADQPVVIRGRVSVKEDEAPSIIAESVTLLSEENTKAEEVRTILSEERRAAKPERAPKEEKKQPILLRIRKDMEEGQAFSDIKTIMTDFPGDVPVIILSEKTGRKFRADRSMYVDGSPALLATLQAYGFTGEE